MSGGGLKRSDGIEEGASVRTGGLRVVTEEDFCCLLFSSFSTAWRPTFSLQTLSSPQDFLHPLHVRSPGRTVGVLLRRAFFFSLLSLIRSAPLSPLIYVCLLSESLCPWSSLVPTCAGTLLHSYLSGWAKDCGRF